MIYLFLFIVFCIPVFFKDKLPFFEKHYWYWGECVLLILVAGLRLVVGGDTQTYLADFDVYPPLEDFTIFHNFLVLSCPAYNKVALVGEIAVPCTCNPLQQG